jgi:hypothetical protein
VKVVIVYLLEITDWDEGEKSIWSVHSTLESAELRVGELMGNEQLDIAWNILAMEVKS